MAVWPDRSPCWSLQTPSLSLFFFHCLYLFTCFAPLFSNLCHCVQLPSLRSFLHFVSVHVLSLRWYKSGLKNEFTVRKGEGQKQCGAKCHQWWDGSGQQCCCNYSCLRTASSQTTHNLCSGELNLPLLFHQETKFVSLRTSFPFFPSTTSVRTKRMCGV